MKKIIAVFGTRPEAIKMCPVIKEIYSRIGLEPVVCLTSQHTQMLSSVLGCFGIVPDYDLAIMKDGQSLADITSRVVSRLTPILEEVKPDAVLVHGDTSTTFAAALASFYQHIPIGHVEAGLRTYNLQSPFPEEFNRQAVSLIASYHFAPTEKARQNLLLERHNPESIIVTGNTAIDALKTTVRQDFSHPLAEWIGGDKLILVTAHRRENIGEPMHQMLRAIRKLAERHPDVKVIYPVHKNPLVRNICREELESCPRIKVVEPMEVTDFHNFMDLSYLILTDSGGIQEEAPTLGKPVLVMRNTTERPEGIAAGTLKLVGTEEETILKDAEKLLEDKSAYAAMSKASNPYGDGEASKRIADFLEDI